MTDTRSFSPAQSMQVYTADALRAIRGANQGDAMGGLADLVPDDVYSLAADARLLRLTLRMDETGALEIGEASGAGRIGARVHLDCLTTLMSPDGRTAEALVLIEVDASDHVAQTYILPLAALRARTDYVLVGAERAGAAARFARIATVAFTRGTRITMATGAQVPIENIAPGDRVLTRDEGAQAVRWIGHSTVRGVGAFAPVRIAKGVLNNANDLLVSPDHRLFIYQRSDRLGVGQPEVLIKARHLVNGDTVRIEEGGFVEYVQILFDRHHIIYAEGIAAESLLVDNRTQAALPAEVQADLQTLLRGHAAPDKHGLDIGKSALDRPDALEALRRASSG
ncbi:MAG: Hint domain-containing protein [Rhodobacteraceae bacterium]|nr:Hint domain-containing protein [Paracoccaceae bacterium]